MLPRPAPHVVSGFVNNGGRITEEKFSYDWLNNLVSNSDNANGFYDRGR
jgi:hypothetical protein